VWIWSLQPSLGSSPTGCPWWVYSAYVLLLPSSPHRKCLAENIPARECFRCAPLPMNALLTQWETSPLGVAANNPFMSVNPRVRATLRRTNPRLVNFIAEDELSGDLTREAHHPAAMGIDP
jgi:hypothetical protein